MASVERFAWRFSPSDQAMATRKEHDWEVLDGDLDTRVPGYVPTIHTSQGLQYPAVAIPPTTGLLDDAGEEPALPGVTQDKRIAPRKAIGIAVRGGTMTPRWTKPREGLAAGASSHRM